MIVILTPSKSQGIRKNLLKEKIFYHACFYLNLNLFFNSFFLNKNQQIESL